MLYVVLPCIFLGMFSKWRWDSHILHSFSCRMFSFSFREFSFNKCARVFCWPNPDCTSAFLQLILSITKNVLCAVGRPAVCRLFVWILIRIVGSPKYFQLICCIWLSVLDAYAVLIVLVMMYSVNMNAVDNVSTRFPGENPI